MRVRILYFASLREAVGTGEESAELPGDAATPNQVRDFLRRRGGAWESAFDSDRAIACAIDRESADWNASITDGAEIAFFPPVTGG